MVARGAHNPKGQFDSEVRNQFPGFPLNPNTKNWKNDCFMDAWRKV